MNETNMNGTAKRLRRTRNGRIVGGVCSGVGEYIGVDPNILRVALGVATFFGGLGFGVYAVAWLLIPEENKDTSIVQDLVDKNKDGHVWQDAKARWDSAQQTWSRPAQPPAGYEQHPYAGSAPVPSQDGGGPTSVPPQDEPPRA